MTSNEHEEKIVEVLESYMEDYLDELQSDLKKYHTEAFRYHMKQQINPPQKIIDFQFDAMAKSFVQHKIRMVKEEIDILENLDMTILDDLAYIFDSYTFTFSNKEGAPDFLSLSFLYNFMSAPIFNAILYLEKHKQRDINWKNFNRDLEILEAQLQDKLKLTENFFPLLPIQSEEEILRTLLTRFYLIYLDPQQDGVKAILSCLSYSNRKRLPKEQEAYMKTLLSDAGYYDKDESKTDYT